MAGLCNRSQWYLQALHRASLVAFYLTHDDSTRLHSRRISLPLSFADASALLFLTRTPMCSSCITHAQTARAIGGRLYVYMCIIMYIYTYVRIYIYICLCYICVYIYIHVYKTYITYIHIYISMCVCVVTWVARTSHHGHEPETRR